MSCTGGTFTVADSDAVALCPGLTPAGRLCTVHRNVRAARNSGTVCYEQRRAREETYMNCCNAGRALNGV